MKILVCVDGSEESNNAVKVASQIAREFKKVDDIAIIFVQDSLKAVGSLVEGQTQSVVDTILKLEEQHKEGAKKLLSDALKYLEEKNIKARTILKEGNPAHVIVSTSRDEGFDIIIMGRRGGGGLKKMILGSVSNAVVQEAKHCNVLIVQ